MGCPQGAMEGAPSPACSPGIPGVDFVRWDCVFTANSASREAGPTPAAPQTFAPRP